MNTGHRAYSYRAENSDTAVVFTHGILGSPAQFTYLVDALGGACCVENLLLPGHGETVREFAASRMSRWQAHLDACVAELSGRYRNIVLVGHSMGCLLSVQTALAHPQYIRGLFMLAMPLAIRIPSPAVVRRMFSALKPKQPTAFSQAALEGNSVRADRTYQYLASLPRFLELMAKSAAARRQVAELELPLYVLQSEKDETVSAAALKYVEGLPNARVAVLPDAGHFYYPQSAKDTICAALTDFIADTAPGAPSGSCRRDSADTI